ncbi:hypothetical protein ACIGMX_16195 [Streptomyces aquilus]|uniref:hypothetical protein n=1 Tax=Streptomyces aquilus TaxID=2548456 RepID=UPI0037D96D16
MSRGSRTLISLYALVALWLAFCTVETLDTVPLWTTLTMAAVSITPVLAVIRETVIAELREVAASRATHSVDQAEAAARAELDAACCERWWTSLGTDHDPTCRHQTPRSSAA